MGGWETWNGCGRRRGGWSGRDVVARQAGGRRDGRDRAGDWWRSRRGRVRRAVLMRALVLCAIAACTYSEKHQYGPFECSGQIPTTANATVTLSGTITDPTATGNNEVAVANVAVQTSLG